MKCRAGINSFLAAACIFFLSACATTTLTAVWKDRTYRGPIHKAVVIGTFRNAAIRNLFEDEFSDRLRAHGVVAIASYTLIPDRELPDRDAVMAEVKKTDADVVIITRLAGRKTIEDYVPGQTYAVPEYYYYWGPYYSYLYSPGYIMEEEYAYAETNIYDTRTAGLVWSARSETLLTGNDEAAIKSFVLTMITRLVDDELIEQ